MDSQKIGSITLTAAQLRDLQSTGRCEVSRKMRPQPCDPLAPWPTSGSCICWEDFAADMQYYISCGGYAPFSAGQRLKVREAWGVGTRPDHILGWRDGIEYRADEETLEEDDLLPLYDVDPPDDICLGDYPSGWRSAATMPLWASRYEVTVDAVRGEQCDGVWRWVATVLKGTNEQR